MIIAFLNKCIPKSEHHIIAGKFDAKVYKEVIGIRKKPHFKNGEPPVWHGKAPDVLTCSLCVIFKVHRENRNVAVRDCVEKRMISLTGFYQAVCAVDSDFCTSVDTILPLPEFNQPGAAVVIKVDWLTIENHMKKRSRAVIDIGITKFPLPRIKSCKKQVLLQKILISERMN